MIINTQDFDFSNMNARGKAQYWWNGWTINKFVPSERAAVSTKGAFHNGEYGFLTSFPVLPDGTWKI